MKYDLKKFLEKTKDSITLFGVFIAAGLVILSIHTESNYFIDLIGFCFLLIALVSLCAVLSEVPVFDDEQQLTGPVVIMHAALLFSILAMLGISLTTYPRLSLEAIPILTFAVLFWFIGKLFKWIRRRSPLVRKIPTGIAFCVIVTPFFLGNHFLLEPFIKRNEELFIVRLKELSIHESRETLEGVKAHLIIRPAE